MGAWCNHVTPVTPTTTASLSKISSNLSHLQKRCQKWVQTCSGVMYGSRFSCQRGLNVPQSHQLADRRRNPQDWAMLACTEWPTVCRHTHLISSHSPISSPHFLWSLPRGQEGEEREEIFGAVTVINVHCTPAATGSMNQWVQTGNNSTKRVWVNPEA